MSEPSAIERAFGSDLFRGVFHTLHAFYRSFLKGALRDAAPAPAPTSHVSLPVMQPAAGEIAS